MELYDRARERQAEAGATALTRRIGAVHMPTPWLVSIRNIASVAGTTWTVHLAGADVVAETAPLAICRGALLAVTEAGKG